MDCTVNLRPFWDTMLRESSNKSDQMSRITKRETECINLLFHLISSVTWATRKDHDHSGLQQFALVATTPNTIAKLPENITDDQGATLPTAINTAQVALYDKDGLGFPNPFDGGSNTTFGNGKSFLVSGGSSVIGLAGNIPLLYRLTFSHSFPPSFWIYNHHHDSG